MLGEKPYHYAAYKVSHRLLLVPVSTANYLKKRNFSQLV